MGYNVLCERFTHDAGRTYHSHVPSLHGDSRLVDILTYGRVLRSDLLLVKAHEVHFRRAYFQEHRPKRGGVVPICLIQLITISALQPPGSQRPLGLWQS